MDVEFLYTLERQDQILHSGDPDAVEDYTACLRIEGYLKGPVPRPIVEPRPYTVGADRPICWQHDNPRLPIKDEFISSNPEFEWSLKGY